MKLDEYKQMVEAQRLASLGKGLEALMKSKAIQEKIRETQAKLAGAGGKGKSLKAKYRRAKRDEAAEAMGAIGDVSAKPILERFLKDENIEVSESCEVALDLLNWCQTIEWEEASW